MREILFRGKRIDNGEWVKGDLLQLNEGMTIVDAEEHWWPVSAETVSQYTGFKDRNRKRIFEGDIVHYVYEPGKGYWNCDQLCVIEWKDTGFYLEGIKGTNKYSCVSGWLVSIPFSDDYKCGVADAFDVVGNIYDKEAENGNQPIDANALIKKLDDIHPVDYGSIFSYETHHGARLVLDDALNLVDDAPALSLNTLRDAVYKDAYEHGLYDGEYDVPNLDSAAPSLMYRIQDEVREAWSAALDWDQGKEGAYDHMCEEIADIIITALSVSGHLGVDIDAHVRRKIEINKNRPYRHMEEKKHDD